MKSPDSKGAGKDQTRFVEKNLRDAKRQLARSEDADRDVTVVFNGRYTPIEDSAISRRIDREMAKHDIGSVIQVMKDGSISKH